MALKKLDWSSYHVTDDSTDIRGWSLVDESGVAVGKIDDLLFDPADNEVRYAIANLDGGRRVMVPIGQISLLESDRRATATGFTRDRLMGLRAYEDTEINESSEREVYRDYNPEWKETERLDYKTDRYRGQLPQRIQLLEEQLRVGKRQVQTGEVEIGKRPITEQVTEQVTLENERIELNRRAVNKPVEGAATIGSGETINVTLFGEEAVVDKKAFVTEEIEVNKVKDARTETINEQVRREELVTEGLDTKQHEFASAQPTEEELRLRRTNLNKDQVDVLPMDEDSNFNRPL